MRHAVKGRKLKRTAEHKKALLTNLAIALFKYKKIKTTVAKAKEARTFVERLITKARKGDIPARRYVARFIKDREALKELFSEIVVKVGDRPGGYTRVVKLGARRGDGADLAILELVDYNEGVVKEQKKKEATAVQPQQEAKKEAQTEVVETKSETTVEVQSSEEKTNSDDSQSESSNDKEKTEN